jgi:hypothetical protein
VEPAEAILGDRPAASRRAYGVLVRRLAPSLPVVTVLAAVLALSFLSGGYIFSRTAPVVLILVPLTAVWVWLAPRRPALDPTALVALSAIGLFALWEGLSIAWSVGPDLSWVAFDVTLLYLIVACVATITPAGPAQLRLAGYGFACVMVPVAVYSFLGKALPDVVTHAHLYARLSAPIGYWNVLAVMLVMAMLPAPSPARWHCSRSPSSSRSRAAACSRWRSHSWSISHSPTSGCRGRSRWP